MFRKGGLLQSHYDSRPLETQMAANSIFCLIVNDFGVEYVGIKHFDHLLGVLQWYHQVQTNMAGNKIAGLNAPWDFPSKQVHVDMKSYVNVLLLSLNWPMPKKPQLSPFTGTPIAYGQKTSTRQTKTHRLLCCQNVSSAFKKLSSPFFIMHKLLTISCW